MQDFSVYHRRLFLRYYVIIFYILALYHWINGMFLYQLQPIIFRTTFDGANWLLMQTGIHQWLIDNQAGCVFFDIIFYLSPLAYWCLCEKKSIISPLLFGIFWTIFNWIYILCYVLFPSASIEGRLAGFLLPILFSTRRIASFYYMLHGIRYLFLFFFVSAGLWKLRNGGVFNIDQMSGILLIQHKEFLIATPGYWYTSFIYWIIRNPAIGYLLYLISTLLELIFSIGFFTKKYDKQLFFLFILFLIMDFVIMRISYLQALPLALPLLFTKPILNQVNNVTQNSLA